MSIAHLDGRFALLAADLAELGDRFPAISAKIEAEMEMISDELALRAAGKSKPSPVVPEFEPETDWGTPESLEAIQDLVILEDQCES